MRALLSTIGSRGDVQPLVALGLALRALGQEVRLCVPPDFREWISGLGLSVVPIGPEVRQAAAAAHAAAAAPPSADAKRRMVEGTVATQFETIGAAAEDCDVMVAATALQVAARSVAERRGIRYVFAAYAPIVLPSPLHAPPWLPGDAAPGTADNRELWARSSARLDATFGDALNAHRAAAGLAPVDDVGRHMFTEAPWLAADPTLGPWPDPADAAVFQPGAWILPDERPLAPELASFLDAGEPPVYFGFGSTRAPRDLGRTLVEAARAVGRRAIVSRGWADLSALDDASDCLAIGEANLRALFRRVAATVHHGGAGTTALAALGGAPQVVVPQLYDQHYWAGRVEQLGIGVAHAPGVPSAESLASALSVALSPAWVARARAVAGAVRTDGAEVAARRLLAARFL
jgi:vancomycin aglycone glucosyltransferase